MIFAVPGMVLATIFVSLPFVVREVVPVLREVGHRPGGGRLDARRRRRSRPSGASRCRRSAGAIIYGVVLTTARALGEYGAVAVVSGRISGKTETLTLFVEQQYQQLGDDARPAPTPRPWCSSLLAARPSSCS